MPAFFLIVNGGKELCSVVGRGRYDLWMGFVFISCALAGTNAMQTSALTSRAIDHEAVAKGGLRRWVLSEALVATVAGIPVSLLVGTLAFVFSGFDWPFALSVAASQLVGFVTSGLFGALMPFLTEKCLGRDAGVWAGPVAAATQDVIGCLSMIVASYSLLTWYGTSQAENDC